MIPLCSRLLILLLLFPIVASGQVDHSFNPLASQESTGHSRFVTGFELQTGGQISAHSGLPRSVNFLNGEMNVGTTLFDLQTNASLPIRLLVETDGSKVATWMLDLSFDDDHPDRGTGLNQYQGEWMEAPTARIESRRTGWSAVSRLGDGRLVVTSHTADNEILIAKQDPSEGWSDSLLPTITPKGRLWPHSSVGGPDQMSVHLVTLSTPTAFEGEPFLGMEGQLLYNRSIDGGETWDVIDAILPGLDSTQHLRIDPDAYAIVSEGSTVAVVHFGGWGDITLFKSLDNGDTWESTIIKDFPLDRYAPDSGYTLDDIPVDTLAPDALAILTSSGEGDLAMGPDGTIHVTYADMYVRDSSMEDGGTTFYPFRSGISYWNESMEDPVLVGGLIDYDNDDSLSFDIREIARYGNSTLTSNPSISLDGQGGVYVTYSAVSEAHFNELDEQNYRHLVIVKSLDNGVNWGPMYDLINDDLSDPEFNDFIEAVYPSTAMVDADTLHILYQQDFFPGHRLVDSMDVKAENSMIYLAVPTDLIPYDGPVPTSDYQADVPIQLFPNPTNNEVNIASKEEKITNCQVQVLNLTGQVVLSSQHHDLPVQLELGFLPSGPYLVKVSSKIGVGWQKLIMR